MALKPVPRPCLRKCPWGQVSVASYSSGGDAVCKQRLGEELQHLGQPGVWGSGSSGFLRGHGCQRPRELYLGANLSMDASGTFFDFMPFIFIYVYLF